MIPHTILRIGLTRAPNEPRFGEIRVNDVRGGPESLLGWLETQLGLASDPIHRASRISEYAAALDTAIESTISKSLATDRWACAAELLLRREDLLLAGWDETDNDKLPPLVRDLARAADGRKFVFLGEAGRAIAHDFRTAAGVDFTPQ